MADGHLNFDTKIDEKGFGTGVKKLGGIAKSGLAVLGGAVGAVTAAMGAGVAAGVKYNSSIENYIANFEVLLGSADAAMNHVAELKQFAASTPFEMNDLAEASKTLLAFGTSADKTMPIMKQLGDVSLGNKDKFQSLALVYGQVSSQGKMMGQDLLQMINAGFNPLLEISEHTGESMESLKDKMSKGQIGVEELDQALQWATEEGGRFAGGMEKASHTMTGMISTLKDNAMALLGEVVQPISDAMTETLLPAALDAIDQLTTAFREDGVEGLIEAGGQILSNVLLGIAEGLPGVIETAVSFINSFTQSLIEQLPSLIDAGGQILTSIVNGIVLLLPTLLELAVQMITQLATAIGTAAPQLIPQGMNAVLNLVTGIIQNLPQIINAGMQMLLGVVQGIVATIPQLIAAIPGIITGFVQTITDSLPTILDTGMDILDALIQGIVDSIPQLVATLPQVIEGFVQGVTQNLPMILESGIEIIVKLVAGLIQAIPQIVAAMPQIVMAIWNGLKNVDWLGLGRDLIAGVGRGIMNGAGAIVEAAKSAAKQALNAAKNFLGIHSPSHVFRDQVGKYMALGMGVGFEDNVPVEDMEKSIGQAVHKVQGTAERVSDGGIGTTAVTEFDKAPEDEPAEGRKVIEVHVHTDLDGKEVAHQIIEFVDDELGEIHDDKERGV